MCPPGYHHSGFVATHALTTSRAQVHDLPQSHCGITGSAHCFHDYTYTYIYIYIYRQTDR